MDPRQPQQLPFSRNPASPYDRSPFPPTSSAGSSNPNQSPYPPSASHPHPPPPSQSNPPQYPPDQGRSAESPHYQYPPGHRPYPPEPGSIPPHPSQGGHSRHHSASSLPPAPSNRAMPPPGSPPQAGQGQQGSQQSQQRGHYGLPPPRAPPVSAGQSTPFAGGRELPSLSQLQRTGGPGSSMSISSMLGGPTAASRDSQPPQSSQYHPPSTTAATGPTFAPSMHASPRMSSASGDYQPFRRPQTPEHSRLYDPRADPRASVAASPQAAYSTTPEMQRFGTPQTYHQRGPSQQDAREPNRLPGGAPPPRPSSQPKSYPPNNMPPRPMGVGRAPGPEEPYSRREEPTRGSMEYNPERIGLKPFGYGDRYRAEKERRDEMEYRERERRERAYSGGEGGRGHPAPQGEYREPPRGHPPPLNRPPETDPRDHPPPLNRPPETDPRDHREHPSWARPPYEQQQQSRTPYDPAGFYPSQHHPSNSGQPFPGPAAPSYPQPPRDRYPPSTHPSSSHPMPQPGQQPSSYDSPERARMNLPHPAGHAPPGHRRPHEEGPPPPPSVAYNPAHGTYDPPRKHSAEEPHQSQNNRVNTLAVQDINRKGRVSPLPQAVQGAQPQMAGPGGEPGIKSEFGRMFSGIGSGVSGIVSSPIAHGAQLPFTNAGLARRDDTDSAGQDPGHDVPGKGQTKGKRRKLKDVDAKGDEDSTGRLTPVGRTKRHKPHHHHHHHHHHGHHHHHHEPDQTSAATNLGGVPFKNIKGTAPIPSPTSLGKEVPHHHHHHHHAAGGPGARSTPQLPQPKDPSSTAQPGVNPPLTASPGVAPVAAVIPPKPKTIISSKKVLDSVTHLRRTHLGDVVYEPKLRPARQSQKQPPDYGFSSTPTPLPWDMIKGRDNCTLTVKVARAHLAPAAREEITRRRALWGTDVYTDDSDVVAACIHGGWIRGEWPEGVDVSLLDLDKREDQQGQARGQDAVPLPGNNSKRGNNNNHSNSSSTKKEKEKDQQVRAEANAAAYHDNPPPTGPVHVQPERDLHITVLVLPRLDVYGSTTRFGIASREFGGVHNGRTSVHDGISFMVRGIRWVENGAGPQSRLRGKGRRERMRRAMAEVKGANWPEVKTIREWGQDGVVTAPGELSWRREAERKGDGDGAGGAVGAGVKEEGEDGVGDSSGGKVDEFSAGEGDKENRPVDRVVGDAPRGVGVGAGAGGEGDATASGGAKAQQDGEKMQIDGQGQGGA